MNCVELSRRGGLGFQIRVLNKRIGASLFCNRASERPSISLSFKGFFYFFLGGFFGRLGSAGWECIVTEGSSTRVVEDPCWKKAKAGIFFAF